MGYFFVLSGKLRPYMVNWSLHETERDPVTWLSQQADKSNITLVFIAGNHSVTNPHRHNLIVN